jgi:hypothetical protein
MAAAEGFGENDMSRLTSAFLGVNLIGAIITFISYLIFTPNGNIAQALGACLGIVAFTSLLAALVGFVSGAVRQGTFRIAFVWGYIAVIPALIFLYFLGNIRL